MRPLWLKAALVLAGLWLIAGAVIFWARQTKPTPERLVAYLEANPIDGAGSRDEKLQAIADQLNALTFEQRREVRMGKQLDLYFKKLQPQEQARFLDLTLPTGFKQMMESLNKMERPQRKRFVEKALRDMERDRNFNGENDGNLDTNARKMIEQGFKSFYSEATADTKMDVAPLIEQLQQNLQGLR